MLNALKSKKGEAYIYLCVIVLFMSLLLSVLVLYMGLTAQVKAQKRECQRRLDSYITAYSIEVFDALKQGDSYEKYIVWNELMAGVLPALGFNEDNELIYENGSCTLSDPEVTLLRGEGFGITVQYVAKYPVVWGGKSYGELTVPITVISYYKMK